MATQFKFDILNLVRKELLLKSIECFGEKKYSIREKIFNRRKFISQITQTTLTSFTASSLISSCTQLAGSRNYSTIGIIGAGIAGLSAADELIDKNVDFKIFEASSRAGGRIFTLNNIIANNVNVEMGGEFIDSNHEDILRLVKKYRLSLIDIESKIKKNNLIKNSYFINKKFIDEKILLSEFKKYTKSILFDIDQLDNSSEDLIKKYDLISISEYLRDKGLTGSLKSIIENAFTAEYGLDADLQSSLNLLTMIDANNTNRLNLYGESDERYKIEGGNSNLIKKMQTKISENIYFDHYCINIKKAENRYKIEFKNGNEYFCKYLIVTIPFTALRKVQLDLDLPHNKLNVINKLKYGTNSKIIFGMNKAPWFEIGRSGYLFSNIIQNGWDSGITNLYNENTAYTIFQGGSFGKDLNDGNSDFYLNQLDEVFSGFRNFYNGKKVVFNWSNSSLTEGSYAVYGVGDWSTFAGLESTPIGNMFFAGEHCSNDFKGYMNGAAETGRIAAENILKLEML